MCSLFLCKENRKNKMIIIGSAILKENSFVLYHIVIQMMISNKKKNFIFTKFN